MSATSSQRLLELAQVFFKLGVIGFGSPADIAMMEEEVVTRQEWMARSRNDN